VRHPALADIPIAHATLAATDPTVLDLARDAPVRLTVEGSTRQVGQDADRATPADPGAGGPSSTASRAPPTLADAIGR
jgi:hypothetical protein